jgi:acetyl-CoA acyltransferase
MAGGALIIDAVRTPVGRRNGMLSHWHPADLLSEVIGALVARTGIEPGQVDDVLVGCLDQVGEQGANVARSAILAAGFPESVPAATIDRQCGSSQQAAHFAAQGVMAGVYDIAIAAGVESMTRVPMWANIPDPSEAYGPRFRERYDLAPDFFVNQGESGEMVAELFGLTRDDCDAFATESHRRAHEATTEGRFTAEIHQVHAQHDDQEWMADRDEGIRPSTTVEGLAKLRTVFREDGVLTAASSSQLSDGAAALLIVSERAAERLGLTPMARFHSFALAGVDPILGLTGPIPATRKALDNAGLCEGNRGRPRTHQRQRRGDRPRPPAGMQRRPADDHAGARTLTPRRPLRPADHVRGRRNGQRHNHRAGLIHAAPRRSPSGAGGARAGRRRAHLDATARRRPPCDSRGWLAIRPATARLPCGREERIHGRP